MGKVSTWQFVFNQLTELPPLEMYNLTGRTVPVVGATEGLGHEAAKHFGWMNSRKLIVTCRQEEKGLKAISGELMNFLTFAACIVISVVLTCHSSAIKEDT